MCCLAIRRLRAALDWELGVLGEQEQVMLRWLAVFAGGCTASAAEECAGMRVYRAGEQGRNKPAAGAEGPELGRAGSRTGTC